MGKRGPKPGSGGRPRKALSEKVLEGNPGKRPIRVLKNYTELEGMEIPNPKEYLTDPQKNGEAFIAKEIYDEVWEWLKKRKCEQFVSPELVEHYSLSAARMVQCERAISTYGFLAKNSQGNAIISPYVSIAKDYMKQANSLWDRIHQIVLENCSTEFGGAHDEDPMEKLLSSRRK